MKRFLATTWRQLHIPKHMQLFIMRFVNDAFLVGVTGIIVNEKHEVLIVKHTYRQTAWSLPGGYLKKGEHPLEGMTREIKEETGFHVKMEKIIKTSHDPTTARLDIVCFGRFLSGTFIQSSEVIEYGFFTSDHLPPIGRKQTNLIVKTFENEGIATPKKQDSFFNKIFHLFE